MAEDITDLSSEAKKLDARITRALEAAPDIEVPAGFAARVAQKIPHSKALTPEFLLSRRRYGRNVAVVCMGVLPVLLLVAARQATGASPLWTVIEWTLCGQVAALAVWLVARTTGSRPNE